MSDAGANKIGSTTWTDEQVAHLRDCVGKGYSAGRAAGSLNLTFKAGYSRLAVIGKALRLGLEWEGSRKTSPTKYTQRPEKAARSMKTASERIAKPFIERAARAEKPAVPEKIAKSGIIDGRIRAMADLTMVQRLSAGKLNASLERFEAAFVPTGAPIDLMKLTDKTCRWPMGEPGAENFGFCGQDVQGFKTKWQKVYCPHHCQLAYAPSAPVQKRRAA